MRDPLTLPQRREGSKLKLTAPGGPPRQSRVFSPLPSVWLAPPDALRSGRAQRGIRRARVARIASTPHAGQAYQYNPLGRVTAYSYKCRSRAAHSGAIVPLAKNASRSGPAPFNLGGGHDPTARCCQSPLDRPREYVSAVVQPRACVTSRASRRQLRIRPA
jgi:hypothetical protein